MKKNVLVFALLSSIFIGLKAQTNFQLGLQISPNIGWMKPSSDNLSSEGSKIGFNYGLIGDFNFSENYSLSTGLTIMSIGGKLDYPSRQSVDVIGEVGGKTSADISLSYIEIPITVKLKTNEIGYITYYGQFGFGLGVNYKAEADLDFNYPGGNGTITKNEEDFSGEINPIRLGLIIGLGAQYNLSGKTSLLFGLTFNNGFTNILKEDAYSADVNGNGTGNRDQSFKSINNAILLNLGVLF